MNTTLLFGTLSIFCIAALLGLAHLMLFSNVEKKSIRIKSAIMLATATLCLIMSWAQINAVYDNITGNHYTTLRIDNKDQRLAMYYINTNPALTEGLEAAKISGPLNFILKRALTDKQTIGYYSAVDKDITILDGQLDTNIWTHELAHHIWYTKLTTEERTNWTTHYEEEMRRYVYNNTGYFVTNYSLTRLEEDYADSFMTYVQPYHISMGWREELLNQQFKRLLNCTAEPWNCFWSR